MIDINQAMQVFFTVAVLGLAALGNIVMPKLDKDAGWYLPYSLVICAFFLLIMWS